MSDIEYSGIIQGILSSSGFEASSISTDEDGYSHKIEFKNDLCYGVMNTENGKIIIIQANYSGDEDDEQEEA